MHTWKTAVALGLSAALAGSATAAGKDLLYVGKPDASGFPNIRVRAGLRDTKGKPVALEAGRLTITEGGAAVSAPAVRAATTPPVVALVVERSAAIRSAIPAIQKSIARFLGTLPKQSRAALVTFGDGIDLAQSLTTNRKKVAAALRKGPVDTGSALFDGIRKGTSMMGGSGGSGVVVAVTVSPDNGSRASLKKVVALARDQGVPVYSIALGPRADKKALHMLSLFSGGRSYRIGGVAKLAAALAAAVKDFRKLPEVTFTSPKVESDGAPRALIFTSPLARKPVERSYTAPEPPAEEDPLADPDAPAFEIKERVRIKAVEGPEYDWVGYGAMGGDLIELEKDTVYAEIIPKYFAKDPSKGSKASVNARFIDRNGLPVGPEEEKLAITVQAFRLPLNARNAYEPVDFFLTYSKDLGTGVGDKSYWHASKILKDMTITSKSPMMPYGGVIEKVTLKGKTYENIRFFRDGQDHSFLDTTDHGVMGFDTQ